MLFRLTNSSFLVDGVSLINSLNESSLHKVLNLAGGVSEYKTCLGPECQKSYYSKFESKAPLERTSAELEPESVKYQFS